MPYAIFVSKRGKPKAAGLPRIWLNGREVGKTEVAVRNDIEHCWENDGKMLVDNTEPLSRPRPPGRGAEKAEIGRAHV